MWRLRGLQLTRAMPRSDFLMTPLLAPTLGGEIMGAGDFCLSPNECVWYGRSEWRFADAAGLDHEQCRAESLGRLGSRVAHSVVDPAESQQSASISGFKAK